MAKYEIPDQTLQNLLAFLNRVTFEGLKENQALNEILQCLGSPLKAEEER